MASPIVRLLLVMGMIPCNDAVLERFHPHLGLCILTRKAMWKIDFVEDLKVRNSISSHLFQKKKKKTLISLTVTHLFTYFLFYFFLILKPHLE